MRRRRLALLCLALSCSAAFPAPPKPLLWQVSDADNSVYLLGSFHMLKAEDYPLADAANRAFDASAKVYFEVDPDEMDDPERVASVMKTGYFTDGGTLEKSLPPGAWRRLADYCKSKKLPVEMFQPMKPWLAALTISSLEIEKAGYLPDLGLDKHYMEMAVIAGKKTAGLETLHQQIEVFERLSQEDQEAFLAQTLKDMQSPEQMAQLHRRWRLGDAEGLLSLFNQERAKEEKIPAFYQRLNSDRNGAWLPQISAFLRENRSDNALVVVGSLHLLGAEGLVEKLKGLGFQVERLH